MEISKREGYIGQLESTYIYVAVVGGEGVGLAGRDGGGNYYLAL